MICGPGTRTPEDGKDAARPWPGATYTAPGLLAYATESDLTFTWAGDNSWYKQTSTYYHEGDAAQSGDIEDDEDDGEEAIMQTTVQGPGTFKFYWKVSSEEDCDYLEFYIDSTLRDQISGEVGWQEKSYTVTGAGTHTLKWRHAKDSSDSAGSDCGWVDYIRWTGPPTQQPENWNKVTYTYDPAGRRTVKVFDNNYAVQ